MDGVFQAITAPQPNPYPLTPNFPRIAHAHHPSATPRPEARSLAPIGWWLCVREAWMSSRGFQWSTRAWPLRFLKFFLVCIV